MTFSQIVDQAAELLRRRARVTRRALRREFDLDPSALDDLVHELVLGMSVATEEKGEVLVWIGPGESGPSSERDSSPPTPPPSQTPTDPPPPAGPLSAGPLSEQSRPSSLRTPTVWARSHEESIAERSELAGHSLVGRERELLFLRELLGGMWRGRGSVLLVGGEAGIGKSRFVRAARAIAGEQVASITFSCSPYQSDTPLFPFIESTELRLGLSRDMTTTRKRAALRAAIEQTPMDPDRVLELLAPLFSLQGPTEQTLGLPAQQQKEETLSAIAGWLASDATRRPILAVWEDLHWADASTLELLSLLASQADELPILHLLTFRPEFAPPFRGAPAVHELSLSRFARDQVGSMVQSILSERQLSPELLALIAEKTGGVPLFVEEIVRTLLDSGELLQRGRVLETAVPLSRLAIPSTLQDSLMVRLERMGAARTIAQIGAVIGREFSLELLVELTQHSEGDLQRDLKLLADADIVIIEPGGERFTFKHALIQDVAYESLPAAERQRYHEQIARILEQQFPLIAVRQPELVAHHYTAAGLHAAAIVHHKRAGERAIVQSAYKEATTHFARAVAATASLPPSLGRDRLELDLLILGGVPTTATRGYSAPEVRENYTRARKLALALGKADRIFPSLYGLWRSHLLRAEYQGGLELGRELLGMCRDTMRPSFEIAARRCIGAIQFYMGEFPQSIEQMRWIQSANVPPEEVRSESSSYEVTDAYVTAHSYLSWSTWMLGHAMQACRESDRAVDLAGEINHTFTRALSLSFASWLHQFRRDVATTRYRSEQALAISTEKGLEMWVGWGRVMQGWTFMEEGRAQLAIDTIKQGIDGWRKTGSELGMAYYLTLLAEAEGRAGRPTQGLDLIADAQGFAARTREHFYATETLRIQGELLHQVGAGAAAVEQSLTSALAGARAVGAPFFALRTASSLVRCLGPGWLRELKTAFEALPERPRERDVTEAQRLLVRLGASS